MASLPYYILCATSGKEGKDISSNYGLSPREERYNIFAKDMRILLVSDIHANLAALETVIKGTAEFDRME